MHNSEREVEDEEYVLGQWLFFWGTLIKNSFNLFLES